MFGWSVISHIYISKHAASEKKGKHASVILLTQPSLSVISQCCARSQRKGYKATSYACIYESCKVSSDIFEAEITNVLGNIHS